MEQILTGDADTPSAGQEILYFAWNQKVHNSIHNSLPMDCVLSQMTPDVF
jgi:hypothetical protein